jgi:hypothetical protein
MGREKKREATEEKRSKKTQAAAAPRNLARGVGGRKASKEERIMLATLLSEPNKVPQVISSLLMWSKGLILVTLLLSLISFTKRSRPIVEENKEGRLNACHLISQT